MSGLFTNKYAPVINTLGGILVQTSLQGLPIPILYGRQRLAPNLIWYGNFFWKTVQGGKKGSSGSGSGKKGGGEYDYGAAIMLGLCQGPISRTGAVWNTQGNLPTQEATETYTVGGSGIYTATNEPTYLGDDGVTRGDSYTVTANDYGSPGSITLTGVQQTPMTYEGSGSPTGAGMYTRNGTNGATYHFDSADVGKTMSISYSFSPPLTSGGVPQDPISTIPFTLFTGTQGQAPWSYLTSNFPSQAIGYTTLAYLASPQFDLGMGGVLPNMNFEVYGLLPFNTAGDCNPSAVLNDTLTNVLYGCGLASGELGDWTNYSNYCVANGLFMSPLLDASRTAADWIKDILEATNSEIVESDGLLKIISYGDTTVVGNGVTFTPATDPVYDLTADDFIRQGTDPPIQVMRPSVQDAYNSERIEFSDRGNSYNPSIVEAQDLNGINLYKYRPASQRTYHFFTTQTAAALCASTRLARDVYIRNTYKFKLPQSRILLDPMDLITVPPLLLGMSPGGITPTFSLDTLSANVSPLPSPWAAFPGASSNLQLISNLVEAAGASPGSMYYNSPFTNDQYAQVGLVNVGASASGIAVTVRTNGPGAPSPYTGYAAEVTSPLGTSQTVRIVKNLSTVLASATATPNAGDILGISAVGTTITLTINGNVICTATDSEYTNGYPGILLGWGSSVVDAQVGSFAAGNILPVASPVPVRILTIDEQEDRTLDMTAEEFPWGCAGPTLYPKQSTTTNGVNQYAPPGNINTPIIFEALSRMNDQIGHSIWFGLSGSNPAWGGCEIWISLDGTTYKQIATAIGQCQMGQLTSALANNTDPDTTDSFGVNLSESFGALNSYTAQETNVFASLAFVGATGSPGPVLSPILADSGSGKWALGITDAGVLFQSPATGTAAFLYLNDSSGQTWQIGVTIAGVLFQTPVSPSMAAGTAFQILSSPSGTAWQITISTSGILQQTPSSSATATTGELIAYENASLTSAYNYSLGTLIRRGVYNSAIAAHPIGASFLLFNDSVEGYDYDVGLIGTTVYFKFTSFNQSGLVQQDVADVTAYPYTITGASIGLLTPAHASYRPLSNPLSAIDAGASATIDIAGFSMRVPGQADIAFGSSTVAGLSYNTLYYVYFSDPGFLPIAAPTYLASTTKEQAIEASGYMFVGSIRTPVAAGVTTYGNGDGGGGAQTGVTSVHSFTTATGGGTGSGTVTNPGNAIDGAPTDFAVLNTSGGSDTATLTLAGAASVLQRAGQVLLQYSAEISPNQNHSLTAYWTISLVTPTGTVLWQRTSAVAHVHYFESGPIDITQYLGGISQVGNVSVSFTLSGIQCQASVTSVAIWTIQ
jgi:hypothetical protein